MYVYIYIMHLTITLVEQRVVMYSSSIIVLAEQVDSVKYLGHFLTNELSDDIYIRRQCRVLNVRGKSVCRKCHTCSVPVKLKLF